jgi:hypothetical protein
MELDTHLTIPPHVLSRLVGEETVLLNLESGIYFGLDGVGKFIWDSVSDGKSLAETVDSIVAEYKIGEDQATTDVVDFTATLVERGLLLK